MHFRVEIYYSPSYGIGLIGGLKKRRKAEAEPAMNVLSAGTFQPIWFQTALSQIDGRHTNSCNQS